MTGEAQEAAPKVQLEAEGLARDLVGQSDVLALHLVVKYTLQRDELGFRWFLPRAYGDQGRARFRNGKYAFLHPVAILLDVDGLSRGSNENIALLRDEIGKIDVQKRALDLALVLHLTG